MRGVDKANAQRVIESVEELQWCLARTIHFVLLTPTFDDDRIDLRQYYVQMTQFGFVAQATIGDWLWKFETIYRSAHEDDFWATQSGFEYTYVGVLNSNADLGLLREYGWDSRGVDDETVGLSTQNDLFFGGASRSMTCKAAKYCLLSVPI